MINIDLSVERQHNFDINGIPQHLGILSTEFVIRWLEIYPNLHKIALFLKNFLHLKQFNNSFFGIYNYY